MSFSYGMEDFLAIMKLVDTVRKQFTDAPGRYKHFGQVSHIT